MENARLKTPTVEGNVSEPSEEASVLKAEVEELRRRLHEAQEREVNSEQRVRDLEEEHEATKVKLSDLQDQQRMMSQEAVELREQCNNYVNEIERLNGASELAIYRAVEKERNKWEEREARWLSESLHHNSRPDEVARSRSSSECAGIPTSIRNSVTNGGIGTTVTLVSPPTCATVQATSLSRVSASDMADMLHRTDRPSMSRDTISDRGARPTTGVDVLAIPPPSLIPSTEARPSVTVVGSGTWGASSGQLTSVRSGIGLTAGGTTVRPSSLCPVDVSCPLTVNGIPSTTSLSTVTAFSLPSCLPTIGTVLEVPSQTTQGGSCVTGSSGHGRWLTSEDTMKPQSVGMLSAWTAIATHKQA